MNIRLQYLAGPELNLVISSRLYAESFFLLAVFLMICLLDKAVVTTASARNSAPGGEPSDIPLPVFRYYLLRNDNDLEE